MRIGGIAHADVANGRGDQNALRAAQGAQHDLNGKLAPVLAPRRELNAGADLLGQRFLGGAQAIRDQALRKSLRNNIAHLLAEQLVAVVAELFFRLQIQQHDLALLVHHHHGIGGGFQQSPVSAFHLHQMRFGRLAYADVADGRRDQDSVRTAQWTQHDFDREFAPVLAPRRQLNAGADLLGQRFLGRPQTISDQALRKALRNDIAHFLAEKLVAVVAELFFRLQIYQNNFAALIYNHHGVGGRLQQSEVLGSRFLGLAQIAGNLGETTQAAIAIAQRRVGGARDILRAVLAHPPPVLFLSTLRSRNLEHLGRLAAVDVRLRKEARETAPDDFLCGVSVDPLGPGVPSHHMAHWIQHEDRVVLNLVQQRPVLILADPQRLLGQAAPSAAADQTEPRHPGDQ